MAFKLDMSKFKVTSRDKHTAKLRHDDGHEITVAVSKLSPAMQKEFHKLPMVDEEAVKLAKGGQVKEPYVEKNKDAALAKHAKEKTSPKMQPVKMANGGPVVDKKSAAEIQAGATATGWQPEKWKENAKKALNLAHGGNVNDEGRQLGEHHGEAGQGYSDSQPKAELPKQVKEFSTPTEHGKKFQEKQESKWSGKNILGLAEGGEVQGAANSDNQAASMKENYEEQPKKKQESGGGFDEFLGHMHRMSQMLKNGPSYAEGGEVSASQIISDLEQKLPEASRAPAAAPQQPIVINVGGQPAAPAAPQEPMPYETPSQAKGMATQAPPQAAAQAAPVPVPNGGLQQGTPEYQAQLAQVPGPMPVVGENPNAAAFASAPQAPAPQMDPQALAHAAGMSAQGVPDFLGGYNQQMAGLQGERNVAAKMAAQNFDTANREHAALQEQITHYNKDIAEASQERDHFIQDLKDAHIDPNHLWASKSTASKISTGIGLILGGIGGGLTGQENPALKFLNQNIDRDVDAQRAELGKKNNLLAANLQKFGNIRDAMAMTRINLKDSALLEMQKTAAKLGGDAAKARFQQAAGLLQTQNAGHFQDLMRQRALFRALNSVESGGGNPDQAAASLQVIRQLDPTKAKELEGRYIPGVGVAKVPVSETVRSTLIAKQTLNTMARDLYDWAKKHSGSIDPATVAQGATKAAELQSLYRNSINGGVFKKGEQEFIDNIVDSDPTKFFNSIRVLPKLKEVIDSNNKQFQLLKKGYGLPSGGESVAHLQPHEQKIAEYALAHPNLPASKAWIKKLGLE